MTGITAAPLNDVSSNVAHFVSTINIKIIDRIKELKFSLMIITLGPSTFYIYKVFIIMNKLISPEEPVDINPIGGFVLKPIRQLVFCA